MSDTVWVCTGNNGADDLYVAIVFTNLADAKAWVDAEAANDLHYQFEAREYVLGSEVDTGCFYRRGLNDDRDNTGRHAERVT